MTPAPIDDSLFGRSATRAFAASAATAIDESLAAGRCAQAAAIVNDVISSLKPRFGNDTSRMHVEELVAPALNGVDDTLLGDLMVALVPPFARLHLGDASMALLSIVSVRDASVAAHLRAVTSVVRRLAPSFDLDQSAIDRLVRTARIFDVGKTLVPKELLHGAAELSNATWPRVKRHAEAGAEVVSKIPQLAPLCGLVRAHHERFDGFGYPDGLRGEGIPLESRIIALADAWHALLSSRPYRSAAPVEEALVVLSDGRGSQWDPAAVDALLTLVWADRARPSVAKRTLFKARFGPETAID